MSTHTCPWWLGWLLTSPLRRLKEDPREILPPYVREGMTVLEPGAGMGFFTLELARLVGPGGRVVAVDLQERMLAGLRRRAAEAGVAGRIETRRCTSEDLGAGDLAGQVDFALLWYMVHEVANPRAFFEAVFATLKPGGTTLLVEPRGHVSAIAFDQSLERARAAGFEIAEGLQGKRLRVLLRRPSA